MKAFSLTLLVALTNITCAAEITVSAAASLTDAFTDIAKAYENISPQDTVYLNFAGSGALLQQIINGAPVDVFAPADQWRIEQAEEANLVLANSKHNFAANSLVATVPTSNTHTYEDINQFINSKTIQRIAIANPEYVPVGRYSKQALKAKNLWSQALAKQIPTQNVRQTLDYVAQNEVDAGFVYQTDAQLDADKVRVVFNVETIEPITYPIAVLKASEHPATAQHFIEFVLSDTGQSILKHYGFMPVQN